MKNMSSVDAMASVNDIATEEHSVGCVNTNCIVVSHWLTIHIRLHSTVTYVHFHTETGWYTCVCKSLPKDLWD